MDRDLSRREYLLVAGSSLLASGCAYVDRVVRGDTPDTPGGADTSTAYDDQLVSSGRSPGGNRQSTGDGTEGGAGAPPEPVGDDVPEPTTHVSADGTGDHRTFGAAYRESCPGDVIALGEGRYHLAELETKRLGSTDVRYDAVPKEGLTVVGRGSSVTTLTFDANADLLSVPRWTFWNVTVDAVGSIVGPPDGKFRACRVASSIMDPPGYAGREFPLEGDRGTLGTTGLAQMASAETARHGITFDRVVNAVDDLGMDPTGATPIDAAFDGAYESGTLVEFPPGEYLVDGSHSGRRVSRFGIRGTGDSRRDVRLLPTPGSALKWLKAVEAGPHLIENLSFDERSDDSSQLSVWLQTTDGSVVKNVEWLGRTPDDDGVNYSLTTEVTDEDGVTIVDQVYAGLDEPATEVRYPDGVEFIRSGPTHRGEVILRDPVIHHRNSNATRFTAGPGVVTIEGGEFVNNQNANVRFGAGDHPSKVSSATGTYVRVDEDSTGTADAVRVGSRDVGDTGAVFRGLTVEWKKDTGRGVIALPDFGGHGRAEFYDCTIRNDGNVRTVNADSAPVADDAIVFENCSFTGSGRGFHAENRSGSVIRDSCIDMPDAAIDGFATRNLSSRDCRRPGNVRVPPTPTITATERAGLTVALSGANSAAPDGTVTAYEWDVGGTTYEGETVTHTFPAAGTYTVSLTVTDDGDATTTTTTELIVDYPGLVGEPPGPTASIDR